jgi:hypothetical protein
MRLMRARIVVAVLTVLVLIALSGPCSAQSVGPFVSVTVGLGNSSPDMCNGCQTGFDIGAALGTSLNPHFSLATEGMLVGVAPKILSQYGGKHGALLAVVQYWPSDHLWLKTGIGLSEVERHAPNVSETTAHPAGVFGIGYAFNPRSTFVFDLSFVSLVSGDSQRQLADEPAHHNSLSTTVLAAGIRWKIRTQ